MDATGLEWKDFFGSSVSFELTLIAELDQLIQTGGNSTKNDENLVDEQRQPEEVVLLPNDSINKVSEPSIESREENNNKEEVRCSQKDETSTTMPHQMWPQTDNDSAESTCKLTKMTTSATLATTVVYENLSANSFCDDRKRPISVNSTSSSSTTSSLPRRYRKKFATSGVNNVNNNVDSDDEKTTSSLSTNLETVHTVSCSLSTVAECSPSDWMSSSSTSPAATSATRFQFSTTGEKRTDSSSPSRCDEVKDDSTAGYCRSSSDDGDVVDRRTGNSVVAVRGGVIVRRVIDEIVETERAYVRDLGDVINGYANSIRSSTVKLGLAAEDVNTLFGNIEQIYQFNRSFLAKLEQCGSDPVEICAKFVEHIEGFAIYSDYCANYPKAITILTKYMHDDVISGALKHQQMALKHVLPLGSYLLKPVQRILKYHLLLQKISKCTSNHHHTYENVARPADSDVLQLQQQIATGGDVILAAVGAMMDVATRVNEMKVGHRLDVRIQELQSEICDWSGPDLTAFGPVILEEKFRISGARASRLVVLFQRAILIAKKRRSDNGLIVKAFIECSNLMLIESVPKEPLSFHVIPFDSPRIQYTIQARNLEQKRLWCQKIKMMILDNYNAVIPEKAKELVMNLGSRRGEDKEDKSRPDVPSRRLQQHPPQRFHQHHASPPQYLEKWRGRRKSAGVVQLQGIRCSVDAKDASSSSALSPTPSPQPRRRSDVTELLYGACTMASTQTSKSCSIDTVASGSVSIGDSITSLSSFDQENKCHYSISSETSPLLERCQSQPTGQMASPPIDPALPAHSDHSCVKISVQPQQQLSFTDDDDEDTNASSPDVVSADTLPVTLTAQRPSIPDIRVEPPPSPSAPCSPSVPMSPEQMESAPAVTKPVNRILREVTGKTNADWMAAVSPANCEPYRRDSIALTKARRASATTTSVVGNITDPAAIQASVSESPTASASPPIAGNLKLLYCEFTESDVGVSGEAPSQSTGKGEPSSQKLQAMTRPGPEGSENADAEVRKKTVMSLPLHGRSLSDPVVREPADGIEEESRNQRSWLARKMEFCEEAITNGTKKFKAVAGDDDSHVADQDESKCEELGGSSEGEDQLWMPRQALSQHLQQQQQQQQQNVEDWQARRKYLRLKTNAQASGSSAPRLSPTSHSSAVAAAIKRRLPMSPSETMLKSAADCSKCSDRQRTNSSDPEFAVSLAERLDPRGVTTLPRRSRPSGKMALADGTAVSKDDFGSVSALVAPSRKVICTEKLQIECPDSQRERPSSTTTTCASWTIPRSAPSKPPSTLNLYQSDLAQEILNDLLVQSPDSLDLFLPSPDEAAGRQKSASLSPDDGSSRRVSWYSLKGRKFSTSYSTDGKSSSSSVNTPNVSPLLDDALFFAAATGSESNISTSASLPRMKAAASNLSRLSTTSTSYDDLSSQHQNRTHDGPVAMATTPERIFDALKETFANFISKIGRGPEAVDSVSGSAGPTPRYDPARRKQLLEQLCQQENRRQLRCVSLDESPAFDQRSRQIGERIAKFFPSRSMDQHFSHDNQSDTSASSAKTPSTTYPVPLPRRRKALGEVNAVESDVKVLSVASTATEGHALVVASMSEHSTA